MSWTLYDICFRLLSPLRLGRGRLGMVQLTRSYVPGRVLWGALTAACARMHTSGAPDHYRSVGKLINDHTRLFYLYPHLEGEPAPLPPVLAPEDERLLIHAAGQTAIHAGSQAAEEASLHESELISPRVEEEGCVRRVFLSGHLAVSTEFKEPRKLGEALEKVRLGGDLAYGFGRLALEHCQESTSGQVFGQAFDPRTAEVAWPKDEPFRAHVAVKDLPGLTTGRLEPMVGLDWGNDPKGGASGEEPGSRWGAGRSPSQAVVCWAPGSYWQGEGKLWSFMVREYGVWRIRTRS